MSTETIKGHVIPTSPDPVNVEATFRTFGQSIHDLPPANSETAANQIAAEPDTVFPVHVWRTDLHAHLVKETPTGEWMQVGGQDFYCVADVARAADHLTTEDLHVDGFKERSEGWTLDGGGIVIPATGIWTLEIYGRMDGIVSTTPGRRFFDYRVNSFIHNQKFHIIDDTSGGGVSTAHLNAGDKVWFRVRNETGERRESYATLKIFRVGNPRLVG